MALRHIKASRLILCEGDGDVAFYRHLIENRGLPPYDVDRPVRVEGSGNTGFARRLEALKVQPGFEHLETVVIASDNDTNPERSYENIRRQVESAGFGVPARPLEPASAENHPDIVVLMHPWVDEPGH